MNSKSLESWIWDAACSIRGAKDAPKYKDYILPLISAKSLSLEDFEADIIGKSYEYLIRKFAEGGGQSDGELELLPARGAGFPGKSSADYFVLHRRHPNLVFNSGEFALITS